MYHTGLDPRTMAAVYVPTDAHDKAMQRALMQWKRPEKRPLVLEALSHACGALVADAYEGDVVAFMDWLPEAAGAETMAEALCAQMAQAGLDGVLVTCQDLTTTADVRRAYLAIRKALPDALRIWPGRGRYTLREMEFAQACRETVAAGEAAVQGALAPLEPVRALREGAELVHTLQLYLLDTDRSVTQTAQALFVHKNTVKYRIQKAGDILGFHIGDVPQSKNLIYALSLQRIMKAT